MSIIISLVEPFLKKNLTFFHRHIFILSSALSLLLVAMLPAQAAPETLIKNAGFGRLFTKPSERSHLDVLRQSRVLKAASTEEEDEDEAEPIVETIVLPSSLTMQGYVKRSDGAKSTVWINNQAIQEESQVDQVRIGKLSATGSNKETNLNLQMPANGKQIRLKAGQVYAPRTDEIKELKTVAKEKLQREKMPADDDVNDEGGATLP